MREIASSLVLLMRVRRRSAWRKDDRGPYRDPAIQLWASTSCSFFAGGWRANRLLERQLAVAFLMLHEPPEQVRLPPGETVLAHFCALRSYLK